MALTTAEAALASFAYVMATLAPSAARRFAIAAPMPREPPVTSATFSFNLAMWSPCFLRTIHNFTDSTDLMCDCCKQIWHSREYHLFPIGMHSAEEETFPWSVFFTSD